MSVSSLTLVQLNTRGLLGESLELLQDTTDLQQDWQLCGGLALSSAHPQQEVVPWHRRAAAREVIRTLAHASTLGVQPKADFAVLVPVLDIVTHAMADLRAWHQRSIREAKFAHEERRWAAQQALRASREKQRKQLASRGFDAAKDMPLAPVHLEKRVSLANYRDAERLANFYRREADQLEVAWEGLDCLGVGASMMGSIPFELQSGLPFSLNPAIFPFGADPYLAVPCQ
jgi:hypothetical protein